jgi:phage gpG-like protein
MGSSVPYAAIHEYGGSAGRNRSVQIPARPYLNPALEKSETKIFRILKLKLDLTIKAAEGGRL